MKRLACFVLVTFWCCIALAADRGPSTQEERDRLVRTVKALELNPVAPELTSEREWAFRFLIEVPDITVQMCTDAVEFLLKNKYKYSSDLLLLSTLEGGRFAIEHPDNKDPDAQALAMVEGVLRGYESLRKADPKRRSKEIDALLAKRDGGLLAESIKGACAEKK